MDNKTVAPKWQRVFCALVGVGGAAAVLASAVHGDVQGWHKLASALIALYGAYLFGYIALRGRLPGKYPGTRYVRFRHPPDRRNT
jgi:hypothetical protein